MATSHQNAMLPSVSAFACAMCHCVGFQIPTPGDVVPVLAVSYPPGAASTTIIDMHDASCVLSSAASSSDGDLNDVTKDHDVPTFGMVQLKSGLVRLYQLVIALVIQITVIASVVVSLKDRITAVEGTRAPAFVHGQETEALRRQVSELCERVTSQEDRVASLEISQRAETDSYKKTIQELTTRIDNMKVDDDMKSRDDALEKLRQSLQNFQRSMECQGARITGVKADTARKIALLQSELAGVQTELTAVKMVAVPVNAPSASQTAKEARKARILASVAQRIEDAEMAEEIEKLCPLPPVIARSPACTTAAHDMSAASTSLGGRSIIPNYTETKETTVKITKEPLTTARTNIARPGANKIPAIPMIPKPTIPMERPIPAKGNGKENKTCNSSTRTTLQDTQSCKPGAGRSPNVSKKPPKASPKKAGSGTGLPSKISALPKPRRSMLPAPRKSFLPSLAKHAAVVDGSSSKEVKTANRLPGGFVTQTKQPKTSKIAAKIAPIVTSRPPSESASSRVVEKEAPAGLPASSSLAALDAALQAMQMDNDDLLTLMPAPNYSNDDLNFSGIAPIPTKAKRNTKNESIYVPPKQRSVDVKPPRSPLKSTLARRLAENEVTLPASSSLVALEAAVQKLQGEGDILTLMSGLDCPSVDFSFSAMTPVFIRARPHCKRESIYVSPMRTSAVKPSRRL